MNALGGGKKLSLPVATVIIERFFDVDIDDVDERGWRKYCEDRGWKKCCKAVNFTRLLWGGLIAFIQLYAFILTILIKAITTT